MGMKKVPALVIRSQHFPFGGFYHGRQLQHIANVQHLNASERQRLSSDVLEHEVDRVEQIRAQHTYFIDYEKFQTPEQLLFLLIRFKVPAQAVAGFDLYGIGKNRFSMGGKKSGKRQMKSGVDRGSSCI